MAKKKDGVNQFAKKDAGVGSSGADKALSGEKQMTKPLKLDRRSDSQKQADRQNEDAANMARAAREGRDDGLKKPDVKREPLGKSGDLVVHDGRKDMQPVPEAAGATKMRVEHDEMKR